VLNGERLTILAGHVKTAACLLNHLAQEYDVSPSKKLEELIIDTEFLLSYLLEELEEVIEEADQVSCSQPA